MIVFIIAQASLCVLLILQDIKSHVMLAKMVRTNIFRRCVALTLRILQTNDVTGGKPYRIRAHARTHTPAYRCARNAAQIIGAGCNSCKPHRPWSCCKQQFRTCIAACKGNCARRDLRTPISECSRRSYAASVYTYTPAPYSRTYQEQIPLTMCPLSNEKLQVCRFENVAQTRYINQLSRQTDTQKRAHMRSTCT